MGLGALAQLASSLLDSGAGSPEGLAGYQSTRVIASFHTDAGYDGAVDSTAETSGGGPAADVGAALGGSIGASIGSAVGALGGTDSKGPAPQPFRIVGLSANKTFGATGSWSLTVKPRGGTDVMRLWDDPEDVWVRIVVVKNGVPSEVVFGLMNTVTESMQRADDGAREVTYTLQGQDFHKVFDRTQLYINIHENAGKLPIIPLYSAVAEKILGTPDSVVRTIIEAWLGNNGVADKQWKLPKSLGGGYFFDLLKLDFHSCRGQIYDPSLYNPDQWMGRSLWSGIEEYSNGLLNELYTTQIDDEPFDPETPRPRLVLRERPFPSKDNGHRSWISLKTHTLMPGDVTARSMSRGAPESRFNYWLLDAKGLTGDGLQVQLQIQQEAHREGGIPGSAPVYSIEDVRRHGFRRFLQSTRFFPFRDNPAWFTHAARWIHLLHDWYSVVPFELAGTINCTAVFPAIDIGHRVAEKRKTGGIVFYYVEGVTHAWQYPGPGLTTLNLTRGEYDDEDLLEKVYAQYNGADTALTAAAAAVDLVNNTPLGNDRVPHGSGVKMDKAVGQVDTPERLFLKRRGQLGDDERRVQRGEPQAQPLSRQPNASDLPDQQVPDDAEVLVGNAPAKRARKPGGNLTQRELEQGKRLPEKGRNVNETQPAKESTDQARERWRKRGGV